MDPVELHVDKVSIALRHMLCNGIIGVGWAGAVVAVSDEYLAKYFCDTIANFGGRERLVAEEVLLKLPALTIRKALSDAV